MSEIEPVTVELVKGAVRSARKEMEALIDRTAMSPFIREKKDYFTAYFDARGRLVSSTDLPMSGPLVEAVLQHYPAQTMRPGDLFLYNDAYRSGGAVPHMPDMTLIAPALPPGELLAFAQRSGPPWVHR